MPLLPLQQTLVTIFEDFKKRGYHRRDGMVVQDPGHMFEAGYEVGSIESVIKPFVQHLIPSNADMAASYLATCVNTDFPEWPGEDGDACSSTKMNHNVETDKDSHDNGSVVNEHKMEKDAVSKSIEFTDTSMQADVNKKEDTATLDAATTTAAAAAASDKCGRGKVNAVCYSRSDFFRSSQKHHRWFKVLRPKEKHNYFQWKVGLNKLHSSEPFNKDKSKTCAGGRLYYADKCQVKKWLKFGDHVRPVTEPRDSPTFQYLDFGTKRAANEVILENESYSLYNPATYSMFGCSMEDNPRIVRFAAQTGNVACLQMWLDRGYSASAFHRCAEIATEHNQIKVLEWWKQQKALKFPMSVLTDQGRAKNRTMVWWLKFLLFDKGLSRLVVRPSHLEDNIREFIEQYAVFMDLDNDEMFRMIMESAPPLLDDENDEDEPVQSPKQTSLLDFYSSTHCVAHPVVQPSQQA
jgi:hypothetical protein